MSLFSQIGMYLRFARGLKKFFGEPIGLEQSRQIIKQRLENRDRNLLTIVKKAIYDNEKSPYLELLRLAGCEYGDFERMVRCDGVEPTLGKLCQQGVCVSIEEFKGKKAIVRGSSVFELKESDFDNPFLSQYFEARSGASRSAGTRTIYDLDFMTQLAVYYQVLLDANDALRFPFSLWFPILPGGGLLAMLIFTKGGKAPAKWFSQVDKRSAKPSLKSRLATDYIVYMGIVFGAKWPKPEYVALDDSWTVAKWIAKTLKEWQGCCMETYVSAAVRICQVARERGLDIEGAKFFVGGEPITQAKRKEIEAVGATVFSDYFFTEGGWVGGSCPNSIEDDVHLFKDSLAVIQHGREVIHAGAEVNAFLFTSLLPSAPKILLNVESGDYGLIETRSCGCKLDVLGFTDHISNIRGFDKLTGEGMTFVSTDLVKIIEQVLPAIFGGASTDYQIMEEEDEQGYTRVNLVVSPTLGAIDEAKLIQTVLSELGKGKDTQRMMAEVWSQANTLQVKRAQPFATARGKLLPLHIQKRK